MLFISNNSGLNFFFNFIHNPFSFSSFHHSIHCSLQFTLFANESLYRIDNFLYFHSYLDDQTILKFSFKLFFLSQIEPLHNKTSHFSRYYHLYVSFVLSLYCCCSIIFCIVFQRNFFSSKKKNFFFYYEKKIWVKVEWNG